jgi:hypothetical protein
MGYLQKAIYYKHELCLSKQSTVSLSQSYYPYPCSYLNELVIIPLSQPQIQKIYSLLGFSNMFQLLYVIKSYENRD